MTARERDRNFAIKPTVPELAEMFADIPCDDSGEAEAHEPMCDCEECQERAESQQVRHMGLMLALPIVAALALIFAAGMELLK